MSPPGGVSRPVGVAHPGYFCKPVPPFGSTDAPLVIVGLAPGMHGANRTGRPFTGDHAGYLCSTTPCASSVRARAAASPDGDDDLALTGVQDQQRGEVPAADNKPATDGSGAAIVP